MANLITGQIVGASLCFNFDDALASITNNTVTTGSDVEEGALFLYEVAGGYKAKFRLPTFDEQFISVNSRDIDPATNPEVSVLIQQLEGGVVTTDGVGGAHTQPMTDYRGTDIVNVYDQYEQFNSSRRRR